MSNLFPSLGEPSGPFVASETQLLEYMKHTLKQMETARRTVESSDEYTSEVEEATEAIYSHMDTAEWIENKLSIHYGTRVGITFDVISPWRVDEVLNNINTKLGNT